MSDHLLGKVAEVLASARSIEHLTRPLLQLLEQVTGLESTYLTRIDQVEGVQTILFSRNSQRLEIPEGMAVPWADTLCRRALEEGRFVTDDVAGCWGDSQAARQLGLQSYVSAPVHLEDGRLFGTLCGASQGRHGLSRQGLKTLSLFATLIAQQIDRENLVTRLLQANATLEAYSFTDLLTGLPNRRAVMAELDRLFALAGRGGQKVLVVFIDLDRFKEINDCYGHDTGDAFLAEVGRRLAGGLRAGDTLARLGGDEFVVVGLAAGAGDEAVIAEGLEQRLSQRITGDYDFGHHRFDYPGASFGVLLADPGAMTPEQALRQADQAMYRRKQARRQGPQGGGAVRMALKSQSF